MDINKSVLEDMDDETFSDYVNWCSSEQLTQGYFDSENDYEDGSFGG
jgi:hypothetical protein